MGSSPLHPNKHLLKPLYQLLVNNFLAVVVVPATAVGVLHKAAQLGPDELLIRLHGLRQVHVFLAVFLPFALATLCLMRRPRSVYLVDYACCRPKPNCRVSMGSFTENARNMPYLDDGSFRFLTRMLERSGLGDQTYLHPSLHNIPPRCSLSDSRDEAEQVIFAAIDDLLAKTGISPGAIDIIVTNCTAFNPTPSFTDMIINKYKLRSDIRDAHISGMGCSAGVISMEVARNLLRAAPRGAHALVVSTETTSLINYTGKNRAMLLPAVLFRMGAAAVLLSTSKSTSRFRLTHVVRTLTAAQDRAYRCAYQEEDDEGQTGINLSKDLVAIAGETLKANIVAIGSLVLPPSEKLLFALSFVARKVLNRKTKLYVPDFRTAFQHFCIHSGGRAVVDAVQTSLCLSDEDVEPSRMTLHRFGNTSSSSLWYELAYIEAKRRTRKGDRVWMVGFGSGFKCNSAVWECIRSPSNSPIGAPWADSIHHYPVLGVGASPDGTS
ncbi:3-ketoacyl-CoA synthase 6 [Triticum urartu]|uniref:3-ketoacyl-CoA synthase n=2 Tax=Triticum urartu TaxID=4572 RepID=M7YJN2_TRIUA|nr:3-ketoacyl-CoA synthase 6-like [Triticum urartu]EMS47031.1 3-ketoacyl-CoA synthase 6 [Triticum urartu]